MKSLLNGIPKRRVAFDLIFAMCFSIANALFTSIMSKTIDAVGQGYFPKFIMFVAGYIVLWEAMEFIGDIHAGMTEAYIENGVYKYYLNKLYDIRPSVLKRSNTGYIAGVLAKTTVRQVETYNLVVQGVPIDIMYVIYFAIMLYSYSPWLSVVAVGTTVFGSAFRVVVKRLMINIGRQVTDAEGERNKLFQDVVSNINTVQKMQALGYINRKTDVVCQRCKDTLRKWCYGDEVGFIVAKMSTYMFAPLCMLVLANMPSDIIAENPALIALIIAISTQLPHNAKSLARAVSRYAKFKETVVKLDLIVDESCKRWPICTDKFEDVLVRNVDYKYIEDDTEKAVTISIPEFECKAKDKICIYGESGQGKTTLLHIISGEIETNGVFINNSVSKMRLDCVFVSQDTEIFDMTLRDNLTLGKDTPDYRLIEYLERVGMGDWFNKQSAGLEVMMGERGVFVSTGQRQRLNLIRGLLIKDKDIYILDEPTSNVDEETEDKIIDLISEVLANKTIIIVTHRPKIKEMCNRWYRFENGVLSKVTL